MHIVGFTENAGQDWFLVKDSWRTAWEGNEAGYYFFHGDYIKLKALAYMVHKEAVPAIIDLIE
jgi:bleomycin hydrolase